MEPQTTLAPSWMVMEPQYPSHPPQFQVPQFQVQQVQQVQQDVSQIYDYYVGSERPKLIEADRNNTEVIKQLTAERSTYMQKKADLQNDINTLKGYNQSLEGSCAILRKEVEKLKKQSDEVTKKLKPTEDRVSSFRKANERLTTERNSLFRTNETLKDELNNLRREHEKQKSNHLREQQRLKEELNHEREVKDECQKQINLLLEEQQRLRSENAELRTDNEQLRTHIVKMEPKDLKPLRDEDYYIQGFEELKSEVEMWSARHAKAKVSQALSKSSEAKLFECLDMLGDSGKSSSQFLQKHHATQVWYSNARTRIPLIRHIIGLFLFRHILEPFAAGLPPELSEALVWIDEDVMSHGLLLQRLRLIFREGFQ
jgi:hypothetical protein